MIKRAQPLPPAQHYRPLDAQPSLRTALSWQALVVFTVALSIRLLDAGSPPVLHDEFYTILAARSYANEGTFRIWQGEYARAPFFTMLVGWSIAAFGDTLFVARLPSVLASALLVPAAFLWLHRTVSPAAAWGVAVLLAISGFALQTAHFARFYALHGLLFWLGAIATYAFLSRPTRPLNYWCLALSLAAVAAAYHVQKLTLIGVAGLAVWAGLDLAIRPGFRENILRRRTALMVAGTCVILIVSALAFGVPARVSQLYAEFRWAALWNADLQDARRFYVHQFAGDLPLLFYLFPFAVLLAIARAPRPACFCFTVSILALILHSFAGMKAQRYVYYVYPFVFCIWAIAVAALLPALVATVTAVIDGIQGLSAARKLLETPIGDSARSRVAGFAVAATLGAALLVALIGNPDFLTLRTVPDALIATLRGGGSTASLLASETKTREALARVVDRGGPLLTSNELSAIYFLGRYDLTIRLSRLDELPDGREFARDPRTGGAVIGMEESFRRVLSCYPAGSMLVWGNDWRLPYAVSPEIADLVEANMYEIPLPGTLKVRAFRWEHEVVPGPQCDALHQALSAPARVSSAGAAGSART